MRTHFETFGVLAVQRRKRSRFFDLCDRGSIIVPEETVQTYFIDVLEVQSDRSRHLMSSKELAELLEMDVAVVRKARAFLDLALYQHRITLLI